MGLKLLTQVVQYARAHGSLPAHTQDPRFATKAPMIRKPVVQPDDQAVGPVTLVVTIMGRDRPGIVSSLADRAQRFGANWSASRMARAAGEFAGMVQFDVPREHADKLIEALRQLESSGLQLAIARSDSAPVPAQMRAFELELVGADRVGIVSQLTRVLAQRGISIDSLHTEIAGGASDKPTFRIGAHLLVPAAVPVDALRQELEGLASEMAVDIGLGERAG
jgi:glycine cleavage system regulatory protein